LTGRRAGTGRPQTALNRRGQATTGPYPPPKTEWECAWPTFLPGDQITVEGPYYDDGTDTTLAITGGTGKYTGAQGTMLLHATGNPAGSEYDFIFTLTR
jgi:hypothetical protein